MNWKKSFVEMSDRAALFAKGADLLREEKRVLLENLDEGALTIDGAGRISYINAKGREILKVDQGEVLGREYDNLSGEFGSAIQRLIEKVAENGERAHEYVGLFELVAISKEEGCILLL